jgi:hypothetical protein
MVRTLENAIKRDRIAHAFLTGRAAPRSIRAACASRAAPSPRGGTST